MQSFYIDRSDRPGYAETEQRQQLNAGQCPNCSKDPNYQKAPQLGETEDGELYCASCGWPKYDEPPGAGDDPFGRPSPTTNPEFWTE